jgi:hypothetical protein
MIQIKSTIIYVYIHFVKDVSEFGYRKSLRSLAAQIH